MATYEQRGAKLRAKLDKQRATTRAVEDELYQFVLEAREDRYPIRQIAEWTGLSVPRVGQIVKGKARNSN